VDGVVPHRAYRAYRRCARSLTLTRLQAIFDASDFVGFFVLFWLEKQVERFGRWVWVLVLLRFALFPAFVFCVRPRLLAHDAFPCVLTALLGFSGGSLASAAPRMSWREATNQAHVHRCHTYASAQNGEEGGGRNHEHDFCVSCFAFVAVVTMTCCLRRSSACSWASSPGRRSAWQ
jgi:hypothetical protein